MPILQDAGSSALKRGLLRDDVYTRLRDAIVDGTFAPGEQLRDGELADWLGVSRKPVREAISTLPSASTPGLKARRISIPRSSDRLPSTPPA